MNQAYQNTLTSQVYHPSLHFIEEKCQEKAYQFLRRKIFNAMAFGLGDAVALSAAVLIAGAIRFHWLGASLIPWWSAFLILGWLVGAYTLHLLPGWGLGAVETLRRVVLLLSVEYLCCAAALFLGQHGIATSRFTMTAAFLLSLILVPAGRFLMRKLLIKSGSWGVPTVIYGSTQMAEQVIQTLKDEKGLGYIPYGVFDENPKRWGIKIKGVPVLGDINQSTPQAPVAIVAMRGLSKKRMMALLEGPLSMYRQVVVVPDLSDVPSLWVNPVDLGGRLGLEISHNLLDPLAQAIKRAVDLVLVVSTAIFWVPLCLIIGLLIFLEDRGNPIFAQKRVRKNGKLFRTLKFRTMLPNAEAILKQKLAEDPALRAEWEKNFKLKKDPRITKMGSFLRKTSLDELPQLINVLRGEMALVGPRPLPRYHQQELSDQARLLRERVRPGITGLWQVSGRSEAGNAGMERWDPYYVRNWSFWLDMIILLRTIRVVINGSGAY